MQPIRVLIADDHLIVRFGLRNSLEVDPEITIVGEAGTGPDTLRQVQQLLPDVLLLDMELPELPGYEVARQLLEKQTPSRIVGISAYEDKHYISELIDLGIAGYPVKEEAVDHIVEAVHAVAQGRDWFSKRLTDQLSSSDNRNGQERLSARELQVMSLVTAGKTNREIAEILGVTEKTIEKHLDNVFRKLDVLSRVEAAVRVIREGWI